MAVGQFHLDGATRRTRVTHGQPHRRWQCEWNERRRTVRGRSTLLIPASRRQRKRSDGVRPWRRATDEIDAVVISASAGIARFSSCVDERRVPATTMWGEIVDRDIGQIQAFAAALYPGPGSYPQGACQRALTIKLIDGGQMSNYTDQIWMSDRRIQRWIAAMN